MQSCGMKGVGMEPIKIVGKSGQISLGKSLAGKAFVLEALESGDILLRHSVVVPASEEWLHSPTMKRRLSKADRWMEKNPALESNVSAVLKRAGPKK
jgi:hypothetical protein